MKNNRSAKNRIRITAYLMAISIIFSQSIISMAAEDKSDLQYITDITALSEKDTELTYEEKPSAEDLQDVLPDTLTVELDGKSGTTEIEVDWECDTDYESEWSGEGQEIYTFTPKWDESAYALANVNSGVIVIPIVTVTIEEETPSQIEDLETAQEDLKEIANQKSILALVYLCDKYEVKDSPSEGGSTVVSVVSGQSVQIEDVDLDEEGNVWYKVSLYQQDKNYIGYIEKKYLATSDEDFLDWTDEYVEEEEVPVNKVKTMSIMTLSDYPDINQFPSSYQNSLLTLKQKYPNWTFVRMDTNLDFGTAVANEMRNDRSWIISSKPASWQNGAAKQSGWSLASEGILRYYMDPRNFLTESSVFQFEQLTYNASYHTESAVQAIIANTFMRGEIPDENMTYARAFTKIGEEQQISPFHLASRVRQEQGVNGTSPLISGKYPGYEGYYNYFNVGASGGNGELIINGLSKAKSMGWNTRYESLRGGASVIGKNYIRKGQDTLYLQKFNVTSSNTYNNQYMQNIEAPSSEAPSIKTAYSETGALNNTFVFKIPVYGNMPASACSKPDTTDTITLNKSAISSLAVDKTEKLIPYVNGSKVDSLSGMTFTSNNTGVATVDAQGQIKAISPGTATITCARNGAKSASCTVTVVKAEPVVDTPVLSPKTYEKGLKLSDIDLPEGWRWSDGSTLLEAGTSSYPAVYTPADTTKYLTVTRKIGLKVSQAIPSCNTPEKLTAKLGSKLGSIELPTGFSWESDEETILDKAGEKTFYLTYDPNDKNYFALNHIPVVVRVIDDGVEPEDPDDQGGLPPGGDSGNGGGTGTGSTGSGSGTGSGTGSTGSGSGTGSGTGAGGTGSGGTSSGSTSGGSTSTGSTSTGSDSTSAGSTGSGSTNTGSDKVTSSSESTTSGNTSSSTSGGSTSTGSTSSGSTNTGSDKVTSSSGSTTSSNTSSSGKSSSTKSSTTSGSRKSSSTKDNDNGNGDTGTGVDTSAENSNANSGGTSENNNSTDTGSADNSRIDNSVTDSTNGSGATGNSANNNGATQNGDSGRITAGSNHSTLLADSDTVTEASEEEARDTEEIVYERPAVTMDMEDVPILTTEMLQMAKEQNVDLQLIMNDRASWHVNVGTVHGRISDIDMNVVFDQNVVPEDLLAAWAQENDYLEFTLAHDGPFGFGAELTILLNPKDSGRCANLFYYDSEADTLEFICACIIDENGYAVFPMEHASGYVIIISDYPMTDMPKENTELGTASGSASGWIAFGIVILVVLAASGTAGYFYMRRRREEEYYDGEDDEDEIDEDGEDIEEIEDYREEKGKNKEELSIEEVSEQHDETALNENLIVPLDKSEKTNTGIGSDEDDWIEDEDWQEPEKPEEKDPFANDHAEDDWIEDDEWDISNDWMDDEEWEKKTNIKKTGI